MAPLVFFAECSLKSFRSAACRVFMDGAEFCCYRFIRIGPSGYIAGGGYGNPISLRKSDVEY